MASIAVSQRVTAPGWRKPPIPFIVNGKKASLRLRTMSFAREISELPAGMKEIHNLLIQNRTDQNENIYMTVAAWSKLRVYEKYWTSFDFSTEEEYLVYFDLPDGATLANWKVLVDLFDKNTFILLGNEVLSFMVRSVCQYQGDTDKRKKDYQEIFDQYCKSRDSFDKNAFYLSVRIYVKTKYEIPIARKSGMTYQEWTRSVAGHRRGRRKRRKVVEITTDSQKFGPILTHDFSYDKVQCSGCLERSEIINAMSKHILKLEGIIIRNNGEEKLPKRPKEIKSL